MHECGALTAAAATEGPPQRAGGKFVPRGHKGPTSELAPRHSWSPVTILLQTWCRVGYCRGKQYHCLFSVLLLHYHHPSLSLSLSHYNYFYVLFLWVLAICFTKEFSMFFSLVIDNTSRYLISG